MPVLLDDDTIVLSTASTHERTLGGFIGELDAKSVSEAQRFVDERLAITRKVRDAMASEQDKQKEYADQHGRKNNEHFIVGDKVLLMIEEGGDLKYRLTLPPYMKTHPVFYVSRLKRYIDPEEITYPHGSNDTAADVDCESSVAADQATRKPRGSPYTNEAIEDSGIEEDSALDAGLSSPVALGCPNGSSGGHTPDGPLSSHRVDLSSVARLDSRDLPPASSAQRTQPATEQQQGSR
ncbi:unnamed protein product [Peronospora farinosa]|uniref:Pol protein n=1 Tax=Peronospora farinosa TaxID=134698 RepID=A0AAV0TJD3_9STRA|nr:unnamed protein product [Peronospora farinosa]